MIQLLYLNSKSIKNHEKNQPNSTCINILFNKKDTIKLQYDSSQDIHIIFTFTYINKKNTLSHKTIEILLSSNERGISNNFKTKSYMH